MAEVVDVASRWAMPVMFFVIPLVAYLRGVKVYEAFIEGAEQGFTTAVRMIPFLVAIFAAMGMFRGSGAMDLLMRLVAAPARWLGVPPAVLPLMLVRPLSGSAALGMLSDLLRVYGPDSYVGWLGSTIQGSTDTTFYILSVYYGSVGVRNPRHSVLAGIIGDLAGFAGAVLATRLLFPR